MDRSPVDPWDTPLRRAIGGELLDGPKPVYDIATAIGSDRSNTMRTLKRLRDDDAVISIPGKPDGHPLFAIADGMEPVLERALAADQPIGHLLPRQPVVTAAVATGQLNELARALRSRALLAHLAWAARIEGTAGQYMFVFSRDADPLASLRLVERLESSGIRCTRSLVETTMSPEALHRHAVSLRQIRATVR